MHLTLPQTTRLNAPHSALPSPSCKWSSQKLQTWLSGTVPSGVISDIVSRLSQFSIPLIERVHVDARALLVLYGTGTGNCMVWLYCSPVPGITCSSTFLRGAYRKIRGQSAPCDSTPILLLSTVDINVIKVWVFCPSLQSVMRIRIGFNADPDPAFQVNADSDSYSYPDPGF